MAARAAWTYRVVNHQDDVSPSLMIQTVPHSVAQRVTLSGSFQHKCPPAPRISSRPLPGQPGLFRSQVPPLFPIDLKAALSAGQNALLSDLIPAFKTISLRDLTNNIICNITTGPTTLTTAEFVQFVQYLVGNPLPSYAELAPAVRNSVRSYFIFRQGAKGRAIWQRFANGTPRFGAPRGLDLLLGHTILWTLHPDPCGVWIATVDVPKDPVW
ncbi:hypothetical protein GGX14DRAFT_573731 [Mycena pura]|uniref:Uncharacterized protein n=1 Tax=Mycena pura TaxID=153505 RepID=A0AAD6UZJ8_9AGAR|nr:hypothetical protein GGX14DRAFT_573731 [Mycena pura]